MRAFRLDTSTQDEQRLDDAENWAWREIGTKSGQLLLPWVCRDGVVRGSGWRSGGPAFFRSLLVQQAWYIFFCVRRPRKSPRTEARAELHVAGVVRGRSLSRYNQVSRRKSPLARPRRCPPQPAAARRSPPQPAAARVAIGAKQDKFFCEWWRVVLSSTQTTRPYSASCDAI